MKKKILQKSPYLIPILIAFIIFSVTIITYYQINSYPEKLSNFTKHEFEES